MTWEEDLDAARTWLNAALTGTSLPRLRQATEVLVHKIIDHPRTYAPEFSRCRNLKAAKLLLPGVSSDDAKKILDRGVVKNSDPGFILPALLKLGFERQAVDYVWSLSRPAFDRAELKEGLRSASPRVRAALIVCYLLPYESRSVQGTAAAKMSELTPSSLETLSVFTLDVLNAGSIPGSSAECVQLFEELLLSASLIEN